MSSSSVMPGPEGVGKSDLRSGPEAVAPGPEVVAASGMATAARPAHRALKILILTQWFEPEPCAKGLAFATALRDLGHEVEVLTGFPNYPGGKLYPGYGLKPVRVDTLDGLRVVRAPLYPSHDSSAMRRIFNYASFAASALVVGMLYTRRPDVIYIYHLPATTGVAGALMAKLRRVPFVFDVQDLWPDTLRATGMMQNRHALSLVEKVCQFVYRRAARIVTVSGGIRDTLVARKVPAEKIDVIYNWCDEAAIHAGTSAPTPAVMAGRFNIVFAGTMGKAQALESVLEAAQRVAATRPEIQFVFIGSGVELDRLKAIKQERAIDNVVFVPRVRSNEVGAYLKAADALLVHLRDDPLFEITIPSKIQAYLAVGKPILLAVRGDAAAIIEDGRCGVVARPEDPADIAAAACKLFDMGEAGRAALAENAGRHYVANFSLAIGARRSMDALMKAVEGV
jgi:glycosyltransferase involved in cell wall biosynthesis